MVRFVAWIVAVVFLSIVAYATTGTPWNAYPVLALGAAIPGLLKSANDRVEQIRNSISGRYATFTTGSQPRDPAAKLVDGKLQRTLRVSQVGTRVKGVEEEANTKWALGGEVHGEFVYGTWEQTEPASSVNKGVFHLRQDPGNRLEFHGQWVGWNPVKCEMGRGDWDWVRQPKKSHWWSRLTST